MQGVNEALQLQAELEAFCRKHNLWVTIEKTKKPDLKLIRTEILIRVDN